MNRLVYFLYYLINTDIKKLFVFINHISTKNHKGKISLLLNMVWDSIKYKISLLEYFQFGFYDLSYQLKKTYAGTGYMYEYQKIMNPTASRDILADKRLFYKSYKRWIHHLQIDFDDIKEGKRTVSSIIEEFGNQIVFKAANGKCGKQVLVYDLSTLDCDILIFMQEHNFDLIEQYIVQHPELERLSPSGVNTVRIFTQITSDAKVEILGCRLRVSIANMVDNLAAGNIAAPLDEATGIITGPGVYSDITKKDVAVHPITGTDIIGFRIPFWQETKALAIEAAQAFPQNRSVGWDIAITETGPDLIEGNHDWCKLVYQLPVKQGLKNQLDRHLRDYQMKTK